MGAVDGLRRLLPVAAFRRLLALRLLSQGSDGVVQVALTSYLFFSPERQTTPAAIAAVTAATLLPFTLVGPFTGIVLDRWQRRDVLVGATALRAGLGAVLATVLALDGPDPLLFAVVVAGFAVNRFLLAGLSAALPHVVEAGMLLEANALVPTAGTVAYVVGLGLGGLVGVLVGDAGAVLAAVAGWVAAAGVGSTFARAALGPDGANRQPAPAVRLALEGLRAAALHLRERPSASAAIALVAAQRFCATLTLAAGILLYRSTYSSAADPDAGLAGLSVAVLAAGIGFVLAAVATPYVVDRWSTRVAVAAGLAVGGVAQAVFALTLAQAALVGAAFALSLGGQGVKICADTIVQSEVDDAFRGRVFVLYDMAFNSALVGAAGVGALVLPPSGRAAGAMGALALLLGALTVLAAVSARPRTR